MGLQDISLRLTDVEGAVNFIKRWVGKNDDLIESALSLSDRVKALEGADIDLYISVLKNYAQFFGGDGLGFLFFTDPHNFADNIKYYQLLDELRKIGTLYNNSPAKFVLCGGDLINTNHSIADAKYYLGRVPNLLQKEIGQKVHIAPGNHDLNVHLPVDGTLTEEELAEIWYGTSIGYYYFDEQDTRCFIFDSGRMSPDMTAYRWTQVDWFANELLHNTQAHVIGLMHIVGTVGGESDTPAELSQNITKIADAFNTRQSITVNNVTYDFINAYGTFHFMLAGHYHVDDIDTVNAIPVLYTKHEMSCDMCFADWDLHVLKTVRFPTNETSRSMPIVYTGDPDNALPIWGVTCGSTSILNVVNRSELVSSNERTEIDSTTYTGQITITEKAYSSSIDLYSYRNGYITLCLGGLESGKSYRITADCTITANPLNNDNIMLICRGSDSIEGKSTTTTIVNGKIDAVFTVWTESSYLGLIIRLGGKSMIISNVNFEKVT